MKAASVTGKQTEVSVQSEVLSEGSSGAAELILETTLMLMKIWMHNEVLVLNEINIRMH